MAARNINDGELIELIEAGTVKHKDDVRVWVEKILIIGKTISYALQQS